MPSSITLTTIGGVRIVVPDSLDLITPYVLREQRDWFEDEIKFVRRLLRPGQKAIDIGSNCGVYALSVAQAVGPAGRVWAFEPTSETARLLAEGIAANGFGQVVLERSALSNAGGTAQLLLNENSEFNALARGTQSTHASETVPLVTLDECMKRHDWREIDYVKIDAEGEEANILMGGERFFAELSPLVQYEIKAGAGLHLELVHRFAASGYDSYRLVPSLDLLVPFDAESTPDGYLLNLFCCKQDRAERLADLGFLLGSVVRPPPPRKVRLGDLLDAVTDRDAYGWRHTLAPLPYGTRLAGLWERTVAAGNSVGVVEALSFYAVSQDSALAPSVRFGALEASFNTLKNLCEREPSFLRLASVARVAQDYGARSLAVDLLHRLSNSLLQNRSANLGEPFLAPSKRFDSASPGEAPGNWVLAAALEEFERLGSYSSFYTGVSALNRLKLIQTLGFGSEEMKRRLHLVRERFGLSAS